MNATTDHRTGRDVVPTAMHELVDVHETPSSVLLFVPILGVGTIAQVAPFQDSTSVWVTALPL